jgi:hypothetical protein
LFAVIGFPHAEYVAIRATRRVANHDHSSSQQSEADNARLAVVPAVVLDLERRSGKTSAASLKSSPRSASVAALLLGSKVTVTTLLYLHKRGAATLAVQDALGET